VAEMVGYPDMFVRTGATINLTCIISRSPEPPAFVFWYHNDRMINYDYNSIGRGQISVHKDSSKSDLVISRLVIRGAKLQSDYFVKHSNSWIKLLFLLILLYIILLKIFETYLDYFAVGLWAPIDDLEKIFEQFLFKFTCFSVFRFIILNYYLLKN
jgi:hypothetical protein